MLSVSFISNINSQQEEIVETFFKSPGIGTTCMENFTSNTDYVDCSPVSEYSYSKKTGPWNGHSSVIFPSLKPDGISKDGTNIICTS